MEPAQVLFFSIYLSLHMDSVICTKCATEEKVLWDKKETLCRCRDYAWSHNVHDFFFPFVVFSTHCTVHIKNWDTPKKLFVKWLFVRHIQCQGTTCGVVQYNSWANSFYIQFAQLGFVGSFFLLSDFIMQEWKLIFAFLYSKLRH